MTTVTIKTYSQRSNLVFILISAFVLSILAISGYVLFTGINVTQEGNRDERMNVLLIIIDDLRPALGCYGDKKAITPNIDQLASKSVLFKSAYAQIASCAASRASFLTGRRPDSLHIYENIDTCKNFTSLPEHFKDNGYETISIGKVFDYENSCSGNYLPHWSVEPYYPPSLETDEICSTKDGDVTNLICPVVFNETHLPDIEIQQYAVDFLQSRSQYSNRSSPFFLAVGFHRPHIPFKFPDNYLDLHPLDDIVLPSNNSKSPGIPNVSWNPWMDFRSKNELKNLNVKSVEKDPFATIPEEFQKHIVQAYYSSVSYIDDQVGKLLEGLESSGYASNTMVMLLSDHGFSLGEHGEWSKYSNFDVSLNVPVLMYVPELIDGVNDHVPFRRIPVASIKPNEYIPVYAKYLADEFIELVDIFPTLAEITNIAVPPICSKNKIEEFCSDGISFFPVLLNYDYPSMDFSWKSAVYSQYPRPSNFPRNDSDLPSVGDIKVMGYTIKDDHFRYTRWVHFNTYLMKSEWGTFEGHELYNIKDDPLEVHNLVDESSHANIVINMFGKLKAGWRKSLPFGVNSYLAPVFKIFLSLFHEI